MPSSGVSPTAALNQRHFLHIVLALERACTHHRDHAHGCAPGTGSERAHHSKHHHHHHDCTHGCETGASAHITTIAHHDRARPPAPLHTHTDRVQQHWRPRVSWHHAQGRSTATSSAQACARTTEQVSEALPRARVDGYGTSAQRAHKCRHVRSRSAGRDGTALLARLAARARHTRRPPWEPGGRPATIPSRRLRSSGKKECLRPRMQEPAMGVRLAPGEREREHHHHCDRVVTRRRSGPARLNEMRVPV